jgi:hypothetical protein
MDFLAGGKGIAFGQPSSAAGFVCAMDSDFLGDVMKESNPIYGAKVLYDNSSGTTGTVTLSDSAANYDYLEIFCAKLDGDRSGYTFVKVYSPDGKSVVFNQMNYPQSSLAQFVFSIISISGTSITWIKNSAYLSYSLSSSGSLVDANTGEGTSRIYKVVGYK